MNKPVIRTVFPELRNLSTVLSTEDGECEFSCQHRNDSFSMELRL